jgi:hypothetical protein
VPEEICRRSRKDDPPCGSGTENASRQEDAPSLDSGTTHERHLQDEHDSQRNHCQERSHQGQHGTRNLETTDVREETSAATEMRRGHEKPRYRRTAIQLRIAEKLDVVEVSAPSGTTKQALDLVEGSTTSKTEKRKQPVWEEPVVEAPTYLARMNVKRECETTDQRTLDHASARVEHQWRKGRMR